MDEMEAIELQLQQQRASLQVTTLVQAQPPAQPPYNKHTSSASSSSPPPSSHTESVGSSNPSATITTRAGVWTSTGTSSPTRPIKMAASRPLSQIKREDASCSEGPFASKGSSGSGSGGDCLHEAAGDERHSSQDASRSRTSSPGSGSDNSLHSRFSASDILHGLVDIDEHDRTVGA